MDRPQRTRLNLVEASLLFWHELSFKTKSILLKTLCLDPAPTGTVGINPDRKKSKAIFYNPLLKNKIILPMKTLFPSKILGSALLLVVFAIHSPAKAAWTLGEWYEGSNGYLYSVQLITGDDLTWVAARSQAQALTVAGLEVDLAPAASFEENNFILYGVNDAQYWHSELTLGPYLGGYLTNDHEAPNFGWVWVSGEPFSFTAWVDGQPDNAGGVENVLQYVLASGLDSAQDIFTPKTWNDTHPLINLSQYYVARTTSAVPEPGATALLAGVGAFMLYFARRRFL